MKTRYLNEILKPFMTDKLTFLTPFDADPNFTKACSNLKNVSIKNPQEFNITDMLRSDLVFMTKDGLTQFEEVVSSRHQNYYRNKKIPRQQSLPSAQYLGEYNPKSRQTPEWTNIIKPTLEQDLTNVDLKLLTPSVKKLAKDL